MIIRPEFTAFDAHAVDRHRRPAGHRFAGAQPARHRRRRRFGLIHQSEKVLEAKTENQTEPKKARAKIRGDCPLTGRARGMNVNLVPEILHESYFVRVSSQVMDTSPRSAKSEEVL